ncbi:MAG: glycerol-3-phosphate dehydrogenase [Alphaproteobacteria bacterium]
MNGAGIARDAAGQGLSVLLCERDDLAGATSSASTKLVHGGLRYLEYYEFRLVREALIEREVLLRAAPHIIWPMRFVLPHNRSMRPAWLVRLGLFLYDHLGGRKLLPGSRGLNLRRHPYGLPLQPAFGRGFEYSDCWVEDSRLVALNARDAADRGATILTRTALVGARRSGSLWDCVLEADGGARRWTVQARALVNAGGPWVAEILNQRTGQNTRSNVRLVKGSHIVVPRLHDGDQAYILQNDDRRIVFVIPYQGDFSLIGTTDLPYEGDPAAVSIDDEEIGYLCDVVNRHFRHQIELQDVVWTYSGVRPLYDDGADDPSAVTRDYVLELDGEEGRAPLLSVFGGKITTYRKLAEHALEKLMPALGGSARRWTADAALPGGEIPEADFTGFLNQVRRRFPWLPEGLVWRLARAYGTRIDRLIGCAGSLAELGQDFGGGLHEAELRYLVDQEFARTAQDVLWRRSKLGLHVGPETREAVARWLEAREAAG